MFNNYLKVAVRNLLKYKGYSIINIAGLAAGMTVCILILLWVQDEMNFDGFHKNADNIYQVCIKSEDFGEWRSYRSTQAPLADALMEEYPEIYNACTLYDGFAGNREGLVVKYEDKIYKEKIIFADQSLFDIFTFSFVAGDTKTIFDNPYSAVITEETSEKYFGGDNPLGKVLRVDNKFDLTVTGVIDNIPKNSHFKTAIISQFETNAEYIGEDGLESWGSYAYRTYIHLKDNADVNSLNDKMNGFLKRRDTSENIFLFLQAFSDIHLYGFNNDGAITYIYIFSTVAVMVLLIACINFMNLSTARSARRANEIGIRKVVGADKRLIGMQFLGESIFLSIVAVLVSLMLTELLLPVFNELSGKELSLNLMKNNLILFLSGLAIITGIFSGIYPAMHLSSFEPVRVLKSKAGTGSALFRKILVVMQFALSIFLIICTLLVSNQLNFMRNRQLGFDKSNIVCVPINRELREHFEAFRSGLLSNPNIETVSAASDKIAGGGRRIVDVYSWEGNTDSVKMAMHLAYVDYDFAEVYGIGMAAGRFFSRDFASDTNAVVLNEAAIREMGMDNPVAKKGPFDINIIGVMKDFNFASLKSKIEPLGFFLDPERHAVAAIKIKSVNTPATLEYIKETFSAYTSDFPFEYQFLDDVLDRQYRSEERLGTIFKYFSILAVFISCLGLLGLASYAAEMRTKEIGIRKVLGATIPGILRLLTGEFVALVIIANIIAWPIAYYAMNKWLQDFAYRVYIAWSIFVFSAVITLIIALMTISYQALRAARTDPVKTLKYE